MNEVPPDKPVRLRNKTCLYCGRRFDGENPPTKEHVIARKFVPHVSFHRAWNLIANACPTCNGIKSDLEDDVSATTMQPDVFGRFPTDDPRFIDKARSKGQGSQSRRTSKPVIKSHEEIEIRGELVPGVPLSFKCVGGPQMSETRAFALARFHLAGFFYWITYQRDTKRGGFSPGEFVPIAVVRRADWGNVQILGFQDLIAHWPHRVHGIGADAYFKVIIRRAPNDEPPLWAWALEWNRSHRLIGFLGDLGAAQAAFDRLPAPVMQVIEHAVDPDKGPFATWTRKDVPLADRDDHLFDPPDAE